MVIPVILGVSLLVFFMIHMIPGDPVAIMLGENAQTADMERLRHELGLDKALHLQLMDFLSGLVRGDLGHSLHSRKPVTEILMAKFPATMELTIVSMLAAILIALPLGIISAVRAHSPVDSAAMFMSLMGVSIPNFWLGPMLILILSVKLDLLPVSGRLGPESYILPAITLGTALAAILTRMTRSSLLEVLRAQ
ncbi:ABC transporter permease, partial [bacterium]|nr:ABC transporter permease [bacterium]